MDLLKMGRGDRMAATKWLWRKKDETHIEKVDWAQCQQQTQYIESSDRRGG